MSSRLLTITIGCGAVALLAGCSSFPVTKLLEPKIEFADAANPAAEIICMWDPGDGKTPDGKPARGFNGTILFFDRRHTAPIGVRGTLTFYVYDDYGPRETWGEPIAEYTFTPEEWDQFFTMGPLGPSYRIFIPYPRTHAYQVNTSLWVKFEPSDGHPAFYSKRAPIVLPGPLMEDDRVQVLETTGNRGYAPEKMQEIVTASFSAAPQHSEVDSRIHTLHRWESGPGSPTIDLANYEVARGNPAGAKAGFSESAPGAEAESWGSTPPALSLTPESGEEAGPPRRRFKLEAPQ